MPILTVCPTCAEQFHAPDHLAGRPVHCPNCGEKLVVRGTPAPETARPDARPVAPALASQHLNCGHCGGEIGLEGRFAGQIVLCPHCRGQVQMPGPRPPAPLPLPRDAPSPTRMPSPSRELRTAEEEPPTRPNGRRSAEGADQKYYVRDHQRKVCGPFTAAELKRKAADRQFDLSWLISTDKVHWSTAAKVKGLFAGLEAALAEHLPTGQRYRNLTHTETVHLFLGKFVLNNENFQGAFPFLKPLWVWWAKLTLPRDFILAEVTAGGVQHVRYNVGTGESQEIDPQQAEKKVAEGIKRPNWFPALAAVLGVVWLGWALQDFLSNFSLTWGTLKTALCAAVALAGFIYKTKRSKVFLGYDLDPAAARRLEEIGEALAVLRGCGQVWQYRVQQSLGKLDWKYNAGDMFKVARLPLALFTRAIPNVETNVKVHGITFGSQAVYFLPEKVLVIDGGQVQHVPYPEPKVEVDNLEYVESEGRIYRDSLEIGRRWKRINRDGSQDRRFKENVELPVVRCGILGLELGGTLLKLMTTNPDAPSVVQEKLSRLKKPLAAK